MLWIQNPSEVITCHSEKPKKGKEMQEIGRLTGVEILIEDGIILAIATRGELENNYDLSKAEILNADGRSILPGFIDSHTHLVWGGERAEEFSWRLAGMDYMEIMKRGGGIAATVEKTRTATEEDLIGAAGKRLDSMLRMGVTTVRSQKWLWIESGDGNQATEGGRETEPPASGGFGPYLYGGSRYSQGDGKRGLC